MFPKSVVFLSVQTAVRERPPQYTSRVPQLRNLNSNCNVAFISSNVSIPLQQDLSKPILRRQICGVTLYSTTLSDSSHAVTQLKLGDISTQQCQWNYRKLVVRHMTLPTLKNNSFYTSKKSEFIYMLANL